MTFFDEGGNRIGFQEWLATYEPYYFLDGPSNGRRINGRNQTSRFVESRVCALLEQSAPLSQQDLILAMAWKMGLIDHHRSDVEQRIVFAHDWNETLTAHTQFGPRNFSVSIPSLAARMPTIVTQINQGNPRYLFDLTEQLEGFGTVYVLTVLFFVSRGQFPIYDRYAHIAAQAIQENLPPDANLRYKELTKWSEYQGYMNLLARIRGACPEKAANLPMFVFRDLDRALWVYGHFFETKPNIVRKTTPARRDVPAPMTPRSSGVLVGQICDLCDTTSDGWRRREINVKQGPDGYPVVREIIHLIDSSGTKYPGLPFIKGARLPGHTCLGQPGALKRWFMQHYRSEQVEAANVYFKSTGQLNEYQIYSEREWRARGQS